MNATRPHRLSAAVRSALLLSLLPLAAVQAQEDAQTLDRIEVTGSRIKKAEIEGQTPVTTLTREDIAKSGLTSVADIVQQLTGSGAWKKGLASHYSRTFSGRGANGERIGPYTMMVAHKTLPFGTLVEIEYRGRRAVAKVADRGPHSKERVFDLGPGVVRVLNFNGVHQVRYRIIDR